VVRRMPKRVRKPQVKETKKPIKRIKLTKRKIRPKIRKISFQLN